MLRAYKGLLLSAFSSTTLLQVACSWLLCKPSITTYIFTFLLHDTYLILVLVNVLYLVPPLIKRLNNY